MRLLYLSICLLLSSGIWSQSDSITTIYLIRHCEKETSSQDPELSEKGIARTQKWADFFEDLPIDLFYSTNTKRTATTCSMIADSQKKEFGSLYTLTVADDVITHDLKFIND